jgi:hypothetical protein
VRRRLDRDLPDVRDVRPEVSAGLAQIVATMTARRREERYPDAEALRADLERVRVGQTPRGVERRATPKATPGQADGAPRQGGVGARIALGVLLLVALLTAGWLATRLG